MILLHQLQPGRVHVEAELEFEGLERLPILELPVVVLLVNW
jgi:hypothetical protein